MRTAPHAMIERYSLLNRAVCTESVAREKCVRSLYGLWESLVPALTFLREDD
jgi:hypothetical protein